MTHQPTARNDILHMVEPCAAGVDIHELQVIVTTRICRAGGGEPLGCTREFRASLWIWA